MSTARSVLLGAVRRGWLRLTGEWLDAIEDCVKERGVTGPTDCDVWIFHGAGFDEGLEEACGEGNEG